MDETTLTFTSSDGLEIVTYRWSAAGAPRAIVQVNHGLAEHAGRYRRFAQALTSAGYVVYAADYRGHGRTAGGPERYGDFGPAGWAGWIEDMGRLGALARSEHPDLPLILVGHSLGSFAAQQYLLDHSADVDVVVLTGTTPADQLAASLAGGVDLTAFNAPFEHRTGFEWLSRDEAEVDAYVGDPACGFPADIPADFADGVVPTGDPARLGRIRPDLPVLVASGSDDPLAGGGAAVELVAQRYRDAGLGHVELLVYPQARHEILNETNRDEVTADILDFVGRALAAAQPQADARRG